MRVLGVLLALVEVRSSRTVVCAITLRDQSAHFVQRVVRYASRVRTHVADQTNRTLLLAQLDAFVELLRQHHCAFHAEAQLAGGLLLNSGCDEWRHRVALLLPVRYGTDNVLHAVERADDRLRCRLIRDLRVFIVAFEETCRKLGRLLREQMDVDGPVLALLKSADFALTLHDQAQRHRLDAACGKPAADLVP